MAEEKSKEEKKIRKINREGVEKMRGKQRLGFFLLKYFLAERQFTHCVFLTGLSPSRKADESMIHWELYIINTWKKKGLSYYFYVKYGSLCYADEAQAKELLQSLFA